MNSPRLLLGLLLCSLALPALADSCPWPLWERFKKHHVSADGRVIDPRQDDITTSEGQAYGLFFALVANDPSLFRQLLGWTENNLARGDLERHLPAWKWGATEDGDWTVLDANNASDADLWIAYSLLEAARLWRQPDYRQLAHHLLWRIAAQTVRPLPRLGLMLLPGDDGFVNTEGMRLNTSYLPPQLLARLATIAPIWAELGDNTHTLLIQSAPLGFAPDWLLWRRDGQGVADPVHGAVGSYDAIRVYLWIGMLDPQAPGRQTLLAHYAPMAALTARRGAPPERVDIAEGSASGDGPSGFSAALLPMLAALGDDSALQAQRQRITGQPIEGYYNHVLALFGLGWDEGRYRFDQRGRLLPAWDSPCAD